MTDTTSRLKTALIVDSPSIAKWQMSALRYCLDRLEIDSVLFCTNSVVGKRIFRHGLYYLLNLFSIQNQQTKPVNWADVVDDPTKIVKFECLTSGAWQKIDNETREYISKQKFDLIIKFGMNLLRDPQGLETKYGVLSFHHGDPRSFRGRPSGFYELLSNCDEISVVVQQLSNRLDGGTIYSFGSYRMHRHSYRRTLEYVFEQGAILLRRAIDNCQIENPLNLLPTGTNYKLPSNLLVVEFIFRLAIRKIKRLGFGLFFRKRWRIASIENLRVDQFSKDTEVKFVNEPATPNGLSFVADPHILPSGKIVCEATQDRSIDGFLVLLGPTGYEPIDTSLLGRPRHLSFPFTFEENGKLYLLPEMASYGSQSLCELNDKFVVVKTHRLVGLEDERLIDPVLFRKDECWYLFAGRKGTENDHLFLWTSSTLFERFTPHPMNPIVISPRRARNAGALIEIGGGLFRMGQNNCHDYGDGITISRVIRLDPDAFEESPIGTLLVGEGHGPHTFSTANNRTVIDYYETVVDPLAWWGRAKSTLKRRSNQ